MSKYRDARKQEPLTPTASQIIFGEKKILIDRPPSMTFPEYWFLRKSQNKLLKRLHRRPANQKILNLMGIRRGYNG